jgi:hypothetical protein
LESTYDDRIQLTSPEMEDIFVVTGRERICSPFRLTRWLENQ